MKSFFRENLTWDSNTPILLLICLVPIILVCFFYNAKLGLIGIVSLLPSVFVGIAPKRKGRISILIFGILVPICIFIGTIFKIYLGNISASILMGLIGYVSVYIASTKRIWFGINMFTPIVAIGLSYSSLEIPFDLLIVMFGSSVFAYFISLLFPEYTIKEQRSFPIIESPKTFGILFFIALSFATLLGFNLDHTGWIVGSSAFVMRPSKEMQITRSIWRIISVLIGASLISIVMALKPNIYIAATLSALVLIIAGGLHKSKLYIMPMFMTYVMFTFILYPPTDETIILDLFLRRILWVGIGIGIAFIFGLVIPNIIYKINGKSII